MTPKTQPIDLESRAAAFSVQPAETPQRVIVALSGGVDSAVAAWLLREAGHDVTGVSLRLAPEDGPRADAGRCCSVDDMTDARQLCDLIGIPFYAIDARDRFREAVFEPFVRDYRAGLTPIPCLACNHEVKFGDLLRTATSLGAQLATGHYARVVQFAGFTTMARPSDRARDQTYYLYGTPSEAMGTLLLPLGDLDKPLVRALAQRAGIPVHDKPDSQEICFVPDGDHARVVEKASGKLPGGRVVHVDGRDLGEHQGVHRYTVGQRRSLHVGGHGGRLYVLDVDGESHRVVVGPREHLASRRVLLHDVNALVPSAAWPEVVEVQVRARHRAQAARWEPRDDGSVELTFEDDVEAVALGQAGVIYTGDTLLGGGIISGRLDGAFPRVSRLPVLA
ncbi:MAG: tRNA 2-thiouridine(34) synthase MnmA [Myxococcota bacterium]